MRKHLVVLISLTVLMLAGCSDPHSNKLPAGDPSLWPEDTRKDIQNLPDEERQLIAGYLVRRAFSNQSDPLAPTTVGEAIENQRKFISDVQEREAEEKALAEKATREREVQIEKLRAAMTVALSDKTIQPKDYSAGRYSARIAFTLALENKTDRDIRGIKGTAIFKDLFGDKIMAVNLSLSESVKAHSQRTIYGYGLDINEFSDEYKKLAVTSYSDLKFEFVPEQIVFNDGSALNAPP